MNGPQRPSAFLQEKKNWNSILSNVSGSIFLQYIPVTYKVDIYHISLNKVRGHQKIWHLKKGLRRLFFGFGNYKRVEDFIASVLCMSEIPAMKKMFTSRRAAAAASLPPICSG